MAGNYFMIRRYTCVNFSKPIDSILFDLDGTLWDASETCARAWNKALQNLGFKPQIDGATVRSLSGLQIGMVLKKYFGFVPRERHQQLLKLYHGHEQVLMKAHGGPLYPHVTKVLSRLKKACKLFIVSNCLAGYIENFIAFHHLQNLFTDFECPGNTGLTKAENIKLIMDRNHLSNPIYVGDTVWDREAAQKAGIPFVYAAYGFGQVNDAAHKIENLLDLEKLIGM